jgi:tRNA-Thr(GGU) m(6)t(6)A37 methyltransferase TsaA
VPQAYDYDWQQVDSRIIIHPEFTDALLGLDAYSHVLVLFWPHQVPDEVRGSKHQLHPLDDEGNPLQGILATRSQIRFNPILVTAARLLSLKRNVVTVRGLDAVDGSPVIDIKPYNPYFDSVTDAVTPGWLAEAAERRRARSPDR